MLTKGRGVLGIWVRLSAGGSVNYEGYWPYGIVAFPHLLITLASRTDALSYMCKRVRIAQVIPKLKRPIVA